LQKNTFQKFTDSTLENTIPLFLFQLEC